MPSFCSLMTDVNSIPPMNEMEMFKPYFQIESTDTTLVVKIKVPSECFDIASNSVGPPSEGSCGTADELEHTISIVKDTSCSGNTETIRTITLNYEADPRGEYIILYVLNNGSIVNGGISRSKKRVGNF